MVRFPSLGIYKNLSIRERQTDDRPALGRLVRSMTYTAGSYFLRDKAIPQFTCFVKNNM